MKDKLEKLNRKAPYYIMKKIGICCSFIIGIGLAVAIPVSIRMVSSTHASDEHKVNVSSSSIYSEDLQSYQ